MARRSTDSSRDGVLAHPLSYVRAERNWTHQDLADLVARRVGNMAARREKVWRWEHWGVVPDDDTQLALAEELGVPAGAVRSVGWPAWLPVGERVDVDIPWTAAGSIGALDATARAAVLDRRGFLVLGAGVAAGIADRWQTVESPRLMSALRGGRVDVGLVECFETRLPALRQMDASLGGASVRAVADSELRVMTELLSNGSYMADVGRRMFVVAAELSRIAGWASLDAGYQAAAERYWVAALRAAHAAGDRALGANVLKCMSLQRVDANLTQEALAIARAARDGAHGAPARVMAMLTVRQARTHAVRGEVADCERLLAEAERTMTRADDQPVPDWAGYFDEAEYCAQVASCYLPLQRFQATDRWLAQSLETLPAERSRDAATYLMWRAAAALGLGEVEQACELVVDAVPSIAAARSVRNRRRLERLSGRLREYDDVPAVQALGEHLKDLPVT